MGGFLGSGKTTAIIHAARLLLARGKRVGIITNEQGRHLVDTGFIRGLDMPTLEVTGGCFCCQLDDFEQRIEEISDRLNPDIVFAESVGSCADLVATVVKPLSEYRRTSAEPASLSVFTDSRLILRYLRGQEMPFSEAVMYIFEKQIEETDLLILNKMDLLTDADAGDLMRLAADRYPQKTRKRQNSHSREDIEDWLALIESPGLPIPQRSIELDYAHYASGEAHFCWLDRVLELHLQDRGSGFQAAELIKEILNGFIHSGARIAHIKFLADAPNQSKKISFTSLDAEINEKNLAEVENLSGSPVTMTINAMIEGDLTQHSKALDNIINLVSKKKDIQIKETARFDRVPGYPRPTIRIGN